MTKIRTVTLAYGCLAAVSSGCAMAASHPQAKHLQQHAAATQSRARACAAVWPQYLQGISSAAAGASISLSPAEVQQAHRDFSKRCMVEGPNSPAIAQVMKGSNRNDDVIDDILNAIP